MTGLVLVTGGTGMIGRHVVRRLQEQGVDVRVLSRSEHPIANGVSCVTGDLETGEGIDAALTGVETVVHCAGSSRGDEVKALHLVEAAVRAGVRHLVYISVVGADRVPVVSGVDRGMFSYFAAKLAGEELVMHSGIPWTILRATQTHELMLMVTQAISKMPLVPLPSGFRIQPVDAGEVGERLAELAMGSPQGLVPDIAGPKVYKAKELLRGYLRASHKHRMTVPLHLPGRGARAFRAGANLNPERAVGKRTWETFLDERIGA